ncbi:MAG: 1-deoxy-D-xylulose-5-phosphate reductoisomerase [Verrucomicrobiales bacterium]|nr:1-deoxy-D-xylulose-5-phosphate reductoisomerase [Verrucomicrobiales bacterium]|tara:strand:- start:1532 stop:2689 length:1158 start_codon:yes stop_codon:yes gene_type:complete
MKSLAVLGATGSIGRSTLNLVRNDPEKFNVFSLVANSNVSDMKSLTREFSPNVVVMNEPSAAKQLRENLNVEVMEGFDGMHAAVTDERIDIVVAGIVGYAGLSSILLAIEHGKQILLANKEAIICAGSLILEKIKTSNSKIIPIDSEHNAIFQCLGKNYECFKKPRNINKIILTASGGPFRNWSYKQMKNASVESALKHPNWKMGKKISVDSATMMNKGLEILEAHWLFRLQNKEIDVIVHPESIVHSMVEFNDKSTLAQLSNPDMSVPIAFGLSWPGRRSNQIETINWNKIKQLSFYPVDTKKFTAIDIARNILGEGPTAGMILNTANEIAVEAFLSRKISFLEITDTVEKILDKMAKTFTCEINSLAELHELHKDIHQQFSHL